MVGGITLLTIGIAGYMLEFWKFQNQFNEFQSLTEDAVSYKAFQAST